MLLWSLLQANLICYILYIIPMNVCEVHGTLLNINSYYFFLNWSKYLSNKHNPWSEGILSSAMGAKDSPCTFTFAGVWWANNGFPALLILGYTRVKGGGVLSVFPIAPGRRRCLQMYQILCCINYSKYCVSIKWL